MSFPPCSCDKRYPSIAKGYRLCGMLHAGRLTPTRLRTMFVSTRPRFDILCFSHLRWDFVYQRPQHLLSRAAHAYRIFFIEEPVPAPHPRLEVKLLAPNLYRVVPYLPLGWKTPETAQAMQAYLEELLTTHDIQSYLVWYYSPMFLPWTMELTPRAVVYDCMDELSLFAAASPDLLEYERALLAQADVVFTGGASLYAHKRDRHPNVHCFPSSIERAHFHRARTPLLDPADQATLPRPRLGYAGVLDERLDVALLARLADSRPDWQVVMVGPTVKIPLTHLPRRPNIHYLGMKPYTDLPAYMANWDVGILPFALNDATRFISPTKTPEYLAAGLPVVSTAIRDVVYPYGMESLAQLWDAGGDVVRPVEAALRQGVDPWWRARVDAFLEPMSWDRTWAAMNLEISRALSPHEPAVVFEKGSERYV